VKFAPFPRRIRATVVLVALGLAGLLSLSTSSEAATPSMSVDDIFCRAKSGVGFSYWWGGSCWESSGCSPDYGGGKGKCTCTCSSCCGDCCTHTGGHGADCSGFTYTVWRLANLSQSDVCGPHGPVAATYMNSSSDWTHKDDSEREPGDALASKTHVMIFEKNTSWGDVWAWEAKGCNYGIVHNSRGIDWGSYAVARRKNVVVGVCTPGQTQSQECGNCGTKKRTCSGNGQWGDWSGCTGQGDCAPGSQDSKSCGPCMHQVRTCSGQCAWGQWSGCQNAGACVPGDSQAQGCGNCGTQGRGCQGDCQWGGWGPCQGEGPCGPGQGEEGKCGDCGSHARTCSAACQWNDWSECWGPDPEGGTLVCVSELPGVCSEGRVRCKTGWIQCVNVVEASPELCDGLDNDCEGVTDNGNPQVLSDPPPPFAAVLEDASFPTVLAAGAEATVWADFRNVGVLAWPAGEVWLTLADDEPGPSPLHVPDSWAAWDVPAKLCRDVPPGGIGRLQFRVRAPEPPGRELRTALVLRTPAGEPIRCPSPSLDLAVRITAGKADETGAVDGGELPGGPPDSGPGDVAGTPHPQSDDGTGWGCSASRTGACGATLLLLAFALGSLLLSPRGRNQQA